jgi:hypothetical protein
MGQASNGCYFLIGGGYVPELRQVEPPLPGEEDFVVVEGRKFGRPGQEQLAPASMIGAVVLLAIGARPCRGGSEAVREGHAGRPGRLGARAPGLRVIMLFVDVLHRGVGPL